MIRTEALTRNYDGFCALNELTIHIKAGEVFGYIGSNGAGKTTTIRILAGLLKPSRGKAFIAGKELPAHAAQVKRLVGYLPDAFGVYEGLRVEEYLDFFGAAFKIPRRDRRKRISHVLEITGADGFKGKFVEALSRGMKQKVGLARTLLHDPKVLLLDEPLSGLDPRARVEVKGLLKRLGEMGMAMLISSHILPELADICDSVGILDRGILLASGPVQEVLRGIRRSLLVELEVLDDPAGAAELLRKIGEAAGVANVEREGREIRFEWAASDQELADLLATIVDKGFRVVSFREVPLSLEGGYMALMQKGQAPELVEPRPAETA